MLFFGRDYEAAAEACGQGLELDPAFPRALQYMAYIRAFQGRTREAVTLAERLLQFHGPSPVVLFALGTAYALAGDRAAALRVLGEMTNPPGGTRTGASSIACIHALLGAPDAGFEWMERAIDLRDPRALFLTSIPWWDSLRADSRYRGLVAKLKLFGAAAA